MQGLSCWIFSLGWARQSHTPQSEGFVASIGTEISCQREWEYGRTLASHLSQLTGWAATSGLCGAGQSRQPRSCLCWCKARIGGWPGHDCQSGCQCDSDCAQESHWQRHALGIWQARPKVFRCDQVINIKCKRAMAVTSGWSCTWFQAEGRWSKQDCTCCIRCKRRAEHWRRPRCRSRTDGWEARMSVWGHGRRTQSLAPSWAYPSTSRWGTAKSTTQSPGRSFMSKIS